MNPETTPLTVDTPYGKLYVAVIPAAEHSYHDRERGNVTDQYPRVRVATDPGFEADPNHADHWTIRRRAYAVHKTIYLHDRTHVVFSNGSNGGRWQAESSPYGLGGFRTDRRGQVECDTKTWNMMDAAVTEALDEFDKNTPGWQEFSRYLLLSGKSNSHAGRAANLRREADAEQAKADELDLQAQPILAAVPESLRSLIRD